VRADSIRASNAVKQAREAPEKISSWALHREPNSAAIQRCAQTNFFLEAMFGTQKMWRGKLVRAEGKDKRRCCKPRTKRDLQFSSESCAEE
jgi:hypothetical protein